MDAKEFLIIYGGLSPELRDEFNAQMRQKELSDSYKDSESYIDAAIDALEKFLVEHDINA